MSFAVFQELRTVPSDFGIKEGARELVCGEQEPDKEETMDLLINIGLFMRPTEIVSVLFIKIAFCIQITEVSPVHYGEIQKSL